MGEVNQDITKKELFRRCELLSDEIARLNKVIEEINYANAFKRLDYLFKVIENKDTFSTEFVATCVDEVQTMMDVSKNNVEES